jgi:hypothetical protein
MGGSVLLVMLRVGSSSAAGRHGRVQGELEAFGVHDGVVVPGAEQNQIYQVGAAVVGPFFDVVGVEFAGAGAGGEAAAFAVDDAEEVT